MRCSSGTTRFVILIGPIAIKFAKIHVLRSIYRLFCYSATGVASERLQKHAQNPFIAGLKYFFDSLITNWNEWMVWTASPECFMAPTFFSFFGIVNIQKRGTPVTQAEVDANHPFRHLLWNESLDFVFDMTQAPNFCKIDGRICIVDYGSKESFRLFSQKISRVPSAHYARL